MADSARSFVALHLDAGAEAAVAAATDRLRRRGGAVRWVQPSRAHLTLKFLGDVPRGELGVVRQALREVPTDGPLALGLDGAGRFPPRGPARVLWAGLHGDVGRLVALHGRIEQAMAALGFEPQRRVFRPHLTLGRVKRPRGIEAVLADLAKVELRTEPAPVEHFVLYESELTPDGAVHTELERFPL